jgi:hypothetical protein
MSGPRNRAASEVDLIGFVELFARSCSSSSVPRSNARTGVRMTPTRLRQAKPWRIQSRDPAKLSRASWQAGSVHT